MAGNAKVTKNAKIAKMEEESKEQERQEQEGQEQEGQENGEMEEEIAKAQEGQENSQVQACQIAKTHSQITEMEVR